MATELVFRADPYARACAATLLAVNERGGLVLDRTVFYATGGGQPGDIGALVLDGGAAIPIATAVWDETKTAVIHVPADGAARPDPGAAVTSTLDWDIRHRRMRMHTALHLLSVVLPYPVTGGSIGESESRLDFDIPDATHGREEIEARLNGLIALDRAVGERWIADAELEANPQLVKTMSVKPPIGTGRVRLVEIEGLDLQPCGGTHVARTGEIGAMRVAGIEKKGRQNRRVRIAFA